MHGCISRGSQQGSICRRWPVGTPDQSRSRRAESFSWAISDRGRSHTPSGVPSRSLSASGIGAIGVATAAFKKAHKGKEANHRRQLRPRQEPGGSTRPQRPDGRQREEESNHCAPHQHAKPPFRTGSSTNPLDMNRQWQARGITKESLCGRTPLLFLQDLVELYPVPTVMAH